jgi:hypothetical protein
MATAVTVYATILTSVCYNACIFGHVSYHLNVSYILVFTNQELSASTKTLTNVYATSTVCYIITTNQQQKT